MKQTDVVVAGRNYCNILTMTRALGEAGYQVDVLRVYKARPSRINLLGQMKPDAYSKYVNEFYECIVNNDSERVIKMLCEIADTKKKKLLMPVDDYVACVVDQNLECLKKYYIVPNISETAGEISRLMDKNEQKKLAQKFDLPMLSGALIKCEEGKYQIPQNIIYPCFVKPNVSMNSTKAKMAKCMNKTELDKLLKSYAQKGDFEMLVEEYADIKEEYSVLGLSTKGGTIAPGIFRVIEGGHKERKGVTITGETVSSARFESVIAKCIQYIESLQYTGLFDVDLIETKDGKIYFIELNFRAGASTHVFTKAGVNLPGIYADYLMHGKMINETKLNVNSGIRFVSEKVLMEEYARSDASIRKVREYMGGADVCFVKDSQDPGPYKNFRNYYFIAALMRIPYRIRDKRVKGN